MEFFLLLKPLRQISQNTRKIAKNLEKFICQRQPLNKSPLTHDSSVKQKRAGSKKDGKPKAGRGRGRGQAGAEGERPVSGKEAVRTSVARSAVPLAKQIKVCRMFLCLRAQSE